MLNNKKVTAIIVMRGLGYKQQEIADELNVSKKTVGNWLKTLKNKSLTDGIYTTYSEYINSIDLLLNKLREEIRNEVKQC